MTCLMITFTIDNADEEITIIGKKARLLKMLYDNRDEGITALDVVPWICGISCYLYDLRHIHGLNIETTKEPHVGGYHGRYRLKSGINIIHVEDEAS